MEKYQDSNEDESNYLTFKDIILTIQEYWTVLRQSMKWIVLLILVIMAYFMFQALRTKPKYKATLTFMVNEDELGGSSVGSLLGQFSGLLGAGEQLNYNKILEIARTRKIAEKVLFQSIEIDGKKDFLANHFIGQLEQDGVWGTAPFYSSTKNPMSGFRFVNGKVDSFDRKSNQALMSIHQYLLLAISTTFKDKIAVMQIEVTTHQELLSYELCNRLFKEMSDFYIDKSIEKQSETYKALKNKADSLKALMSRSEYGLASMKDSYRSTWLHTQDVPKTLIDRDIKMTALVYGEVVKNLELASFSLQNKTPYIQSIDQPLLPLLKITPSIIGEILKAILLGVLIGSSFFIAKYFIKKQMTS